MSSTSIQSISNEIENVNSNADQTIVGSILVNRAERVTVYQVNSIRKENNDHQAEDTTQACSIEDSELRKHYNDSICLTPLPWYEDYTWSIKDIYTDLAIDESGKRFPLQEVFVQAQQNRYSAGSSLRIVIEGDAGYGKSTLVLKLAYDWANHKSEAKYAYLGSFDLLLKAQLGLVGENGDLESHLKCSYENWINVPLDDIFRGSIKQQVLIVLDGYDEAQDATKQIVNQIIEKRVWPKCHVIVTSRFGHVPKQIKEKTFSAVVKGYDIVKIGEAVSKFFIMSRKVTKEDATSWSSLLASEEFFGNLDEATSLLPESQRHTVQPFGRFLFSVLHESPYKDLAQCPLLCTMMCCLIGEFPNSQLPETLSGLYFAMINRNLYRAYAKRESAQRKHWKEWDLDSLQENFHEDHRNYLTKFGFLSLEVLRKNDLIFTLSKLMDRNEVQPDDPEVRQLVEAGVIIKSFGQMGKTVYQVPHRTTAEFLAAYYISNEKETASVELALLDLFAKQVHENVFQFCFEMKCPEKVINAFCDIKFPKDFFTIWPFLRKHLADHTDSTTLSENWSSALKALPHVAQLTTNAPYLELFSEYYENLQAVFIYQGSAESLPCSKIMTINNAENGLKLVKNSVDVRTNSKFARSPFIRRPLLELDFFIDGGLLENIQDSLGKICNDDMHMHIGSLKFSGSSLAFWPAISIRPLLERLLQSENCPVHLGFRFETFSDSPVDNGDFLLTLKDAFGRPSHSCGLKSLDIEFVNWSGRKCLTAEDLLKVLMEHWLSNRLEHLGLHFRQEELTSATIECFIDRCTSSDTLRSLHLAFCTTLRDKLLDNFIKAILGSRLEIFSFSGKFIFNVTSFPEYVKMNCCRLKNIKLKNVTLKVKDPHLFGATVTPLALEKVSLTNVTVSAELADWLCSCLRSIRVLTLCSVRRELQDGTTEASTFQVLNTLMKTNFETLEELKVEVNSFIDKDARLFTKALERCSHIHTVKLLTDYNSKYQNSKPIYESILNAPKLRITTAPKIYSDPGYALTQWFWGSIADRAEKWSGRSTASRNVPHGFLTIHDCDALKAAHAVTVFRQRKLDYRIQYVGSDVYKIWFPTSFVSRLLKTTRRMRNCFNFFVNSSFTTHVLFIFLALFVMVFGACLTFCFN